MVKLEKGLSTAMNARLLGSGDKTVILAHGYGGDQSVWDKILPYLTQRYRVMVFDWIFSGSVNDSTLFDPIKYASFDAFANDLISLVDEMELKSTFFVGHSMSGMIGCAASIKRPDLFNKLILLAASPRYLNSEDYEGGFKEAEIEQIISNIESNFHTWALSFASFAVDSKDPLSLQKFQKCLGSMRPEVALSVAKTIFYSDERELLEKVSVPCTIIQPTNDIVVPLSVSHYMEKKIKGKTEVEIIECDGHFPQLTAHLLLIDLLDRVLGFECDI